MLRPLLFVAAAAIALLSSSGPLPTEAQAVTVYADRMCSRAVSWWTVVSNGVCYNNSAFGDFVITQGDFNYLKAWFVINEFSDLTKSRLLQR